MIHEKIEIEGAALYSYFLDSSLEMRPSEKSKCRWKIR